MAAPDVATQTMIANLEAKTGRSLGEWIAIALEIAPKKNLRQPAPLEAVRAGAAVHEGTRGCRSLARRPRAGGHLEASGNFNAMVSHRVRVESVADVDAELIGWLRQAYDRA